MLLALVSSSDKIRPPASIGSPQVVFSWDKVQVAWPNETMRQQHVRKAVNVIGVKVWKDLVYVTVPRWHGNGHPLNVAKLQRPDENDATVRYVDLEVWKDSMDVAPSKWFRE